MYLNFSNFEDEPRLGGGDKPWSKNGDKCRMGGLAKFLPDGGPPSPPRKKTLLSFSCYCWNLWGIFHEVPWKWGWFKWCIESIIMRENTTGCYWVVYFNMNYRYKNHVSFISQVYQMKFNFIWTLIIGVTYTLTPPPQCLVTFFYVFQYWKGILCLLKFRTDTWVICIHVLC